MLNSKVSTVYCAALTPTVDFNSGVISKIPFPEKLDIQAAKRIRELAPLFSGIARNDWDENEFSWDFTSLPLLNPDYRQPTLKATYQKLRAHWREMTLEMQRLEEENNRTFIDAYGLQDELTPEVPLNEITLTCNPNYRYGNDKIEDELEALLLADTMRELLSYAVGCMFGRYALDKPGLILANQGETIEDYLKRVPEPSFPADEDNVLPFLDDDWFADDIVARMKDFLAITFGREHLQENISFVEDALGRDLRNYFLKDFYKDHIKRYKKRPIYWMVESPKGGFRALIYMHRYRPDTMSVVLNGYLREYMRKLRGRLEHLEKQPNLTNKQRTEFKNLKARLTELEAFERETLFPLAGKQIEIDLDDGVKVNYPKFGKALAKVVGLS
jgi:hypothetical protein